MINLFFAIVLSVVFFSAPATATVFFFDDFEDYSDISDTAANWSRDKSKTNITIDQDGGYGGGGAVKFTYSGSVYSPFERVVEQVGAASLYVRFKVKFSESTAGGIKFLKFFGKITNGNYYANFTYNFGGMSGPSFLTALCYGPGDAVSNDTQCCVSSGSIGCGLTPTILESNFYPTPGQWYTVDAYVRYSTDGNSDGEMWMDIDGVRQVHLTEVKNRHDLDERVISKVSFGDYSNSSAQMTLWVDDVEMSTDPIPRARRLSLAGRPIKLAEPGP